MKNWPDNSKLAQAALELLQTAHVSGAEVPKYVAVNNWLTAIMNNELPVVGDVDLPEHEHLRDEGDAD